MAARPHHRRPRGADSRAPRRPHARGTGATAHPRGASMSDQHPRRTPALELGLRRVRDLDAIPLPDSDPALVERIAGEIRRSGPMTFARFMELALYDPEAGYYTS